MQHADNPVDWYPWGEEAFRKAKQEDNPIFLSIGYSTCHWCHVMAHESFEDEEVAALLNEDFVCIKVDKEERPDIDSIYMTVCQAFTGNGGWPTSIFMTPDQKPFFAGTYFPKNTRGRMIGFTELLRLIHKQWESNRDSWIRQAEQITAQLRQTAKESESADAGIPDQAALDYQHIYDTENGGFGTAPNFPSPHNLMFLLSYYERYKNLQCLEMVEKTLLQMYRGGMFDHIGYGFCRYSTDSRFLVPHFEKMLYDNALLIQAYSRLYAVTKDKLYLDMAKKTAKYILTEMTSPDGGFYSAQDADCDGEEGKYYLLNPDEILSLLGKEKGMAFNRRFDITEKGNFEGKSIPNLLGSDPYDSSFDAVLPQIREYRRARCKLHTDDKILTAWNGLMIAALCELYRVSREQVYLAAA